MSQKITEIQNIINTFVFRILQIVMLLMVMMVIGQVFSRYVLNNPNQLVEEILRFSLIWSVMLGSISCFINDEHIALTLLVDSVSPMVAKILHLIIQLITIFFIVVVMIYGGIIMSQSTMAQLTPLLQISMGVVYSIIPISGVMIFLVKILQIIQLCLTFKNSEV